MIRGTSSDNLWDMNSDQVCGISNVQVGDEIYCNKNNMTKEEVSELIKTINNIILHNDSYSLNEIQAFSEHFKKFIHEKEMSQILKYLNTIFSNQETKKFVSINILLNTCIKNSSN